MDKTHAFLHVLLLAASLAPHFHLGTTFLALPHSFHHAHSHALLAEMVAWETKEDVIACNSQFQNQRFSSSLDTYFHQVYVGNATYKSFLKQV